MVSTSDANSFVINLGSVSGALLFLLTLVEISGIFTSDNNFWQNLLLGILKAAVSLFKILLVLLFRFNNTETGLGQIEIKKSMSFSDLSSTYFNKLLILFIKSMYHFPASLPFISFTLFTASSLNGLAPKPYTVSVGYINTPPSKYILLACLTALSMSESILINLPDLFIQNFLYS